MGQERDVLFALAKGTDASRVEANSIRRCVYSSCPSKLSINSLLRSQIQEAFHHLTNVNATRERQKEDSYVKAIYLL